MAHTGCLLVLVATFCGCSPQVALEKAVDDETQKTAKEYIQRLVDGDTHRLASELDPSIQSDTAEATLEKLSRLFPKDVPKETNLVGFSTFKQFKGDSKFLLTFQFGYGTKWIIASVGWVEHPDGSRTLFNLKAQELDESLQVANAFSFQNAGPVHYVFLLCVVAVPVFILFTLVVCIRTKIRQAKWMWILLTLLGVVQLSLNWTTGQVGFRIVSFQLLGAGAVRPGIYGPWTLMFSVPAGAILFWAMRKSLTNRLANSDPGTNPGGGINSPPA